MRTTIALVLMTWACDSGAKAPPDTVDVRSDADGSGDATSSEVDGDDVPDATDTIDAIDAIDTTETPDTIDTSVADPAPDGTTIDTAADSDGDADDTVVPDDVGDSADAADAADSADTPDTADTADTAPSCPEGSLCDDGLRCTVDDTCRSGVCEGSARVCDDGIACTADRCSEDVAGDGCSADASGCQCLGDTDCRDADACNGLESCDLGSFSCVAGSAVDCHHLDDQCRRGTCTPASGACLAEPQDEGLECDDGTACTLGETCSDGDCGGGTPVVCSASDECHVAGVCSTTTGLCSNPAKPNGTPCSDSPTCGVRTCQSGVCSNTGQSVCDPGELCQPDGSCACDPAAVSFAADVQPIFSGCTGCHDGVPGGSLPSLLDLRAGHSYALLVGQDATQCSDASLRVEPGNVHDSYLIRKVLGARMCGGLRMPAGGGVLASAKIATLGRWICQGADND